MLGDWFCCLVFILYCVHGTIQYTQYKLQVPSFWQSLSCLSKKISEKKKVMWEYFREFLEWLQCPTREELHEWGTQKTYFLSCDKCHWVTCTFNVQKLIDGKGKVTKVKLHNLNVYKTVLHILFVGNGLQTVSSVASRDDHLIPSVFFIFSSTCKAVQAA